jgi:Endo-alpha-N-acetylgalactosaminidase
MDRRKLLKNAARLAGGGAVSRTLQPVLGLLAGSAEATKASVQASTAQTRGMRRSPAKPIVVKIGDLKATFDSQDGMPYAWDYKGKRIWGEDEGVQARAIVCQFAPREYRTLPVQLVRYQKSNRGIVFDYRVEDARTKYATFSTRFAFDGSSVTMSLEIVKEQPGFELIEVAVPQLMTVREEDGPAWMAEGRKGGSFVRLENARAYRFPDNEYFGRISTELPVGMVGRAGIGCVMEVTAFMDGTETEIKGTTGSLHALLGFIMTHRVHGGRCYNMNDGGPSVCGNDQTLNLLVGQMPKTRFDFFACEGEDQPWMTGTKIVRSRMPASPTQYLSDRFLYIVAGKKKVDPLPQTTFAQSKELVRDVALLTDNAPQVICISGWAYDGQDTGFPSEDKVNSSLGTDADLRELIQSGKQFNANITLNVNYDDAYMSSPIFNEGFIGRRPDGKIWKSRAWDGEDSYVVGMAKFVEGGWANRRIAYTVDHYKIHDAMLIDAMSWFAVRNDWDPKHPASAYKNLVDGKYKVVKEFRERGIAVTSEQLRYPFIGVIAESMDGPGTSNCPFGGEAVPMLSTIYRGAAIWGGNPGGAIHPQQEVFWNTRSALWFQADSDRGRATDFYYLVVLPFSKLHRLAVESYESKGTSRRLILEKQSQVEMTAKSTDYSAVWNGTEIARDDATFCPVDDRRIAFYATSARTLRYPLPSGWDPAEIVARTLSLQGRSICKIDIKGGMIMVKVEARKPVIVYENESYMPTIADLA